MFHSLIGLYLKLMKNKGIHETDSSTEQVSEIKETKQGPFMSKATKHTIMMSVIFGVSFALIGGFGGYALYTTLHPKTAVVYNASNYGTIPTKNELDTYISKNTLLDTFNTDNKAYSLLNYALFKQAAEKYTLTISKGTVLSSGITQTIESTVYNTPDETFSQNISSSSIVSTANRTYDRHDQKLDTYDCKKKEDWANNPTCKNVTYDSYIQSNGKLNRGNYYCTSSTYSSDCPITDRYLTNDQSVYEASTEKSKHVVNAVMIYDIGPKTVTSSSVSKTKSGYEIKVEVTPDKGTFKSSVQMKTTGGLASYPKFSSSNLTIQVDEEFNLISHTAVDEYTAVIGPINSPATQNFTSYYFRSDTDTFNDVKVTIPEISDISDFKGYQLFPSSTK